MGVQRGRDVEIFNSFEVRKSLFFFFSHLALPLIAPFFQLVYEIKDGKVEIDQEFLTTKKELFAQPFPNYDILGWYVTADSVTKDDLVINDQFHDVVESPLVLVLDPLKAVPTAKRLPIDIYEAEIRMEENKPTSVFAKLVFKIETGESERVAVDHIAHVKPQAEGDSALAGHLEGVQNAIQMLLYRVRNLQRFVDATLRGEVPKDHSILRQISSLAHMLPAIDSTEFRDEFLIEYNDTLLVTYMATVTKAAQLADELNQKYAVAYGDKGRRRGGAGPSGFGFM